MDVVSPSVLNLFHPVIKEWFEEAIGMPSPPQVQGWPAIERGENVLITAPTGAGKTLSAFMVCINELFVKGLEGTLTDEVQVVYISPLKALNNDIYRNLEVPLDGIRELCERKGIKCPQICKAVRTGDTPVSDRKRMQKAPPHILITTPESLYLILTSANASSMLINVKYLIIDEIHTLLGNKRGTHLALSVERLEHLTGKPLQRIGLSATIRPIDEAARYLGGFAKKDTDWEERHVTVVQPVVGKTVDLKINIPVKDYRVLEEGTVWPDIYKKVLEHVRRHKSTLVFVNNRAVAEKVAANLNNLAGEVIARTHHGCISKESRLEVESMLKSGELPCLVATSSLELGIDIGAVDLVVQIASPKSVSRGLQRLGRAGHRLSAVSKGRIIPKTRADLLECVIISQEMLNGGIEEEKVPHSPLDVLSQHLVAMSCVKDWTLDEIIDVVKGAYSYQSLKTDELLNVLSMLAGDFEHYVDTPRSPRVLWDRVNSVLKGSGYSRMLAIGAGGTIPDRGQFGVYLGDGKTRLGELDEQFVYESRMGDKFMLGTSAWRIEKIKHDRVIVAPCSASGARTPFWTGDGLGRPYELGIKVGAFLRELSAKVGTDEYLPWILSCAPICEDGALNLEQYIIDQKNAAGCLMNDKRVVVEYFSDEAGERRIVIHSPFGGRINGGLAIIVEKALTDALHCQVQASHNDDGLLINIFGNAEHPKNIFSLLKSDGVENILIDALPTTPLFSMTFRYNAARALMMGTKKIGKRSPLWIQRLKALEVLQVAEKFTNHPLIIETYRECMEKVLDVPGLINVLKGVETGQIEVFECVTSHPSPFTSELLFNFMGVAMYEGLLPNPQKLRPNIISHRGALNLRYPSPGSKSSFDINTVLEVAAKNRALGLEHRIKSADELHSLLLTYGDLRIDEDVLSRLTALCEGAPLDWLIKLESEGRIMKVASYNGCGELWIAVEERPMYLYALGGAASAFGEALPGGEDLWTREEALSRIVRRFARYNSPFTEEDVSSRYPVAAGIISKTLSRLEEDGVLVRGGFTGEGRDEWCHEAILERIRKYSIAKARRQVKSNKVQALAEFLPRWQGVGREIVLPAEDLYETIMSLRGMYLPLEWWEDFVFPSRIKCYRPSVLDRLCSSGRILWRVRPGEANPHIAWYMPQDIDYENDAPEPENLTSEEGKLYNVLKKKGASFLHTLSAALSMESGELIGILESLVWKGIVVNDSAESLRYFMAGMPEAVKARAKRRAAFYKMDMGRWEIASPVREFSIRDMIGLWLKRYGILCREILQSEKSFYTWTEVYEVLKQMEYTGEVSRGYYIEGISGMQFMQPSASEALNGTPSKYFVLNACDPAQAYGRIAPRGESECSWSCIPGTVLVLKYGGPVLIVEGFGDRFTPVTADKDDIIEGIKAFVEAFNRGSVWRNRKKIKMKQWGDTVPSRSILADELCTIGFEKEMQEMVLWRQV